jgi:Kdo2-lipid IVA lauroyltransferase/acyltransferase
MSRLLYYLVLLPVSKIPFWCLYSFSDFLYFVLYRIIGYRKKVVRENLVNSFPHRSKTEIDEIEKGFYHHLCDIFLESIKMFSITEKEMSERFVGEKMELLDNLLALNKHVILTGGHLNNWEWLALYGNRITKFRMGGVYKELSNPYFEKKMRQARGQFGALLIPTTEAYNFFLQDQDEKVAMIFATDQSPRKPENCYWTTFLNQETGIQPGAERTARKYQLPVVYGALLKVKRGYYKLRIEVICSHPDEMPQEGAILEKATRLLEAEILKTPEQWLWSHRRWKHKKPENVRF